MQGPIPLVSPRPDPHRRPRGCALGAQPVRDRSSHRRPPNPSRAPRCQPPCGARQARCLRPPRHGGVVSRPAAAPAASPSSQPLAAGGRAEGGASAQTLLFCEGLWRFERKRVAHPLHQARKCVPLRAPGHSALAERARALPGPALGVGGRGSTPRPALPPRPENRRRRALASRQAGSERAWVALAPPSKSGTQARSVYPVGLSPALAPAVARGASRRRSLVVGGASRWLPGAKGKGKGRGGGGAEALGAAQVLHEFGVQLVVARSGPSQDSGRRPRPRRPVPGPPGQHQEAGRRRGAPSEKRAGSSSGASHLRRNGQETERKWRPAKGEVSPAGRPQCRDGRRSCLGSPF
ncbi:hypothetical protein EI555_003772 [Monodon monoceros]|uniref:Uncharacterized protein n=1 Tax=Monodon monoceros TaxID=40151 RepID=A0A4V5P8F3_MONMO|nr:hypothetical protein EI555_003772 [Monodon monoceros]